MKRRHFLQKASIVTAGLLLPSVLMNCVKEYREDKSPSPSSGIDLKVLVLGAGMSGLAAASLLKSKGVDVQVIEASSRYGGRIDSVDFEGYIADCGASWIHGISGNPLYSLANENAITTRTTYYEPSYIFDMDGTDITEEEWNTIKPYLDQLSDIACENQELSLQGVLEIIAPQLNLNERLMRLFYGAVRSEIEIPYAIDAADISARALCVNDSFPGNDVIFPSGMHQLTDVLAKNLDIIYNTFVVKIDYSDEKVKVYTKKYADVPGERACNACHDSSNASTVIHDQMYVADKVIVALPPEMLKNENVVFSPPLPASKKSALGGLEMGVMNKVFLKFENTFWSEDGYFLEILKENHSEVIEFFNPVPVGAENILVAVLSGYHAKSIESLTDDEVRELVMNDLRGMYGENIPQPVAIHRTAWHTNPLSLGCYPHLKPGYSMDVCDAIARSIQNQVFFAGDASTKKYMATAHGAYISGRDAAQEILDFAQ